MIIASLIALISCIVQHLANQKELAKKDGIIEAQRLKIAHLESKQKDEDYEIDLL